MVLNIILYAVKEITDLSNHLRISNKLLKNLSLKNLSATFYAEHMKRRTKPWITR